MKRTALVALVALVINGPAVAEPKTYTCTAEKVAGFRYSAESKSWIGGSDKANTKFLIKRREARFRKGIIGGPVEWDVEKVGSDGTEYFCEHNNPELWCKGVLGTIFFFSKITLRFMTTIPVGYVTFGTKERPDSKYNSPHMLIGKCSPL